MKSPLISMPEKWNCLTPVGSLPHRFSAVFGVVY